MSKSKWNSSYPRCRAKVRVTQTVELVFSSRVSNQPRLLPLYSLRVFPTDRPSSPTEILVCQRGRPPGGRNRSQPSLVSGNALSPPKNLEMTDTSVLVLLSLVYPTTAYCFSFNTQIHRIRSWVVVQTWELFSHSIDPSFIYAFFCESLKLIFLV